ncbi:MAG: UDP-N-acetylglucosamine--N-acetylmuramyl-(pentapeptide) pyrophosphoryl-undecaprenol [Actinomycetota bacterium]|jgi:UDP-N-acetylglucosamine--N-acetylmuramyl-(pentapeptide) pyrophosphoryl-undecaprenol N-acetylglucosamine transferase|nr:UDP-N-acetylglucosamine--N-acetylmuramyl-(pentapeptide) pyrophosphoryl-undecaprenol [Actinomycetota bacterium]
MRVAIAGGGTVGHVQPAIALARALTQEDVSFIGTANGAEARLVPAAQFPFSTIAIRGFDRARPASLLTLGPRAAAAVVQARALLRQSRPDVVVGMGGYVSLPVCAAARLGGTPFVIHEQNIVLGLANKLCGRFAARVAVSWEDTVQAAGPRAVFTGNPVLPEIVQLDREERRPGALDRFGLDPSRKTLLVFGGSQGAHRINEAAIGLARRWSDRGDRQVLHIVGPADFEAAQAGVVGGGQLPYRIVDFLPSMLDAYSGADLALCRGGATTVAELTTMGLPAIIVPYPFHRDRQQERHARVLQEAGAVVTLPDPKTTTRSVGDAADALFDTDGTLATMSVACRTLSHPRAADALAEVVREAAA